jgi:hypothetical protein
LSVCFEVKQVAYMPKDMLSVSTLPSEIPQETSMKTAEPLYTLSDNGDFDFSKLLEKPRPLNIERQRSFDERSLSELSAMSPHLHSRNADTHFEGMLSPCRRSVSDTPRSTYNSFEPHPTIADAWDTLRRSLVYFRGKPVGTIAAMDHSEELLNYNQVHKFYFLFTRP